MQAGQSLPAFLETHSGSTDWDHPGCISAIFRGRSSEALTHALWWPPPSVSSSPRRTLLFVPGNPGLLEFYIPFLSAIHRDPRAAGFGILALSYTGHTPDIKEHRPRDAIGLKYQVVKVIDILDSIQDTFGKSVPIVLAGHSVGGWIALQAFKTRTNAVAAVFLLFPTLSHIAKTPNGRVLAPIFSPRSRSVIASLARVGWMIPTSFISMLFRRWPLQQVLVLMKLIRTPSSVFSALSMAHDECKTIKHPDIQFMTDHRDRLWFYYGASDAWVGNQKEAVLHALGLSSTEPSSHTVVQANIPHAFCINHGEEVAEQVCAWLVDLGF